MKPQRPRQTQKHYPIRKNFKQSDNNMQSQNQMNTQCCQPDSMRKEIPLPN